MTSGAYFTHRSDGSVLVPEPSATSNWSHAGSMLRGMAVSAALARGAEQALACQGVSGLHPVRWTVDLSRPVAMRELETRSTILRAGTRLVLVQVDLIQEGALSATSRALFLRPGGPAAGDRWSSTHCPPLPPDADLEAGSRLYYSKARGWSTEASVHHNASPKQIWQTSFPTVAGEEATPFQIAAGAADLSSVATHWGTNGLTFVNADISMSLIRLPCGPGVGVVAHDRWERDGIAIGTALMHDRRGVFGTSTVSAIGNTVGAVDPGSRDNQ